jgi:triacylglycerol lipase
MYSWLRSVQIYELEVVTHSDITPKSPVVFCHGLMGFDTVNTYIVRLSHWRGIREILESNGVEVLITRVPGTGSIEERAKVLERAIVDAYAGRSVHLVGHSMVGYVLTGIVVD